VRNEIIDQLHQTKASPTLKRDSLQFLDRTEAAHTFLMNVASDSTLGGEATRLLAARFQSITPKQILQNTLPVADPASAALDAISTILQSHQRLTEKQKSVESMLKRIAIEDRLQVLSEARPFAKKLKDKAMIDKLIKEVKP